MPRWPTPRGVCSVDGCERPHDVRGLCGMHFQRVRRHGSIDDPRPTQETRFWSKVAVAGPSECWLWTASRYLNGYGMYYFNGRVTGAHRVAFLLKRGAIPEGLELDHLCRVRHCVNPAHLEPVTQAENIRRAAAAKTYCRNGHPFDDENTYVWRGRRACRICRAAARERNRPRDPDDNERLVGVWERGRLP